MKTVRMRTLAAGPNGAMQPGTEQTLEDAMAKGLVEGGFAEFVSEGKGEKPAKGEGKSDSKGDGQKSEGKGEKPAKT